MSQQGNVLVTVDAASFGYGDTLLWRELDFSLRRGEFLAVLGPNGSGKSSLIKVLLGLAELRAGGVHTTGRVGYIPQHHVLENDVPIRARDFVQFGLDGHQFGLGGLGKTPAKVFEALQTVSAAQIADQPVGRLSGGEQQRVRIAQALVSDPDILLCDEPLLSLDVAGQQAVSELISNRAKQGAAVIFVTHEINQIMPYVDKVLYLARGKWKLGAAKDVLTTASLSELYGTAVEVVKVGGRIVVLAGDEPIAAQPEGHHHHEGEAA